MRPTRRLALLLASFAIGGTGCVNGARSGTPPVGVGTPPVVAAAPALPPPPPPESSAPSSPPPPAPRVWRAEYYKISDG